MEKKYILLLIRKSFNECFPICLHGLSPGDCTMAIQPLEDNHQNFTKKNCFMKSKLHFKDIKKYNYFLIC